MRGRLPFVLALVATATAAQPTPSNLDALTASVATSAPAYGYGEPIEVRYTLTNGSDEPAVLVGSPACQAQFVLDGFESQLHTVCTTIEEEIPIPARASRTWVWVLRPQDLGLPVRSGRHTLVGRHPARASFADTTTFEAPRYLGGLVGFSTVPGVTAADLQPLRDSLRAEVVYEYGPGPVSGVSGQWRVSGVQIDSVAAVYLGDARFRFFEPVRHLQYDREFVTGGEAGAGARTALRVRAAPNPSSAGVVLFVDGEGERVSVEVTDRLGRRVAWSPSHASGTALRVDVSEWAAGVYLVRVVGARSAADGRFTVLR